MEGINSIKISISDKGGGVDNSWTSLEIFMPKVKPKFVPENKEEKGRENLTYCEANIRRITNVGIMEV